MKLLLIVVLIVLNCSCKSDVPNNYMAFENIVYLDKFPKTVDLTSNHTEDIGVIGMRDFIIKDSLMIVGTTDPNGYWKFVSLNNNRLLGSLLLNGNGPGEFINMPYVNHAVYREDQEILYCYVYNTPKSELYKINISESLSQGKLQSSVCADSIPSDLFTFIYLDSTKYFCRQINNEQNMQLRFYYNDKTKHIEVPEYLNPLNNAFVRPHSGNHNIISTIIKHNPKNNIIVEMPIGLNNINIYSVDGRFCRTICVGSQVDNVSKIEELNRWKRPYTYASMRLYDDFFGVLYLGETDKSFQQKRKNLPKIYLFDYNGTPKMEVQLNHFATTFDIDLHNGYIYTLDSPTEELYKYNAQDVIHYL